MGDSIESSRDARRRLLILQERLHHIVVDELVLAVCQDAFVVPLLPRDDRRLAVPLVVRLEVEEDRYAVTRA
jgi:hypothetical protein